MFKLLQHFPKQLGIPARLPQAFNNPEELLSAANKLLNARVVYYSLYNCEPNTISCACGKNPHYCSSALIDKIVFDLDKPSGLQDIKRLCAWADSKSIQHLSLFSGRGFHFYVFTKDYQGLKDGKAALRAAQQLIAEGAGLRIGMPEDSKAAIDQNLIGDTARLMRLPNTLHSGTRLFCIPLTHDDLKAGLAHIRSKAGRQCWEFHYYGSEKFSMTPFKEAHNGDHYEHVQLSESEESIINAEQVLKTLPASIARLLLQPYVYHHMRYHIILYLKESGFSQADAFIILKRFLEGKRHPIKSKDNFASMIREERQLQYIYNRHDLFFSWQKMREEGLACEQDSCEEIYA